MDPVDFSPQAPGELVKTADGLWSFVPNPLPPRLTYEPSVVTELAAASLALGQLGGAGQNLPNAYLLISPFLLAEAVASNKIEGTTAGVQDVLFSEAVGTANPDNAEVWEVLNYVHALETGLRRIEELGTCLRLIRELHGILLTGGRGGERDPGEFRRIQNAIGGRGPNARFVPPPVPRLQGCLSQLETYMATDSQVPPLVKLALIHYQFEAIHPFMDGNGRIGRLLLPLLLCHWGYLPQPLIYLSAYFERNRDAYIDRLLRVSQAGEWLQWIQFFLQGVKEQAQDAVIRSEQLMALREQYRERLQLDRASGLTLRLVDRLFASPTLTARAAREHLGVTARSAQLTIDYLVDAGILREMTGQKRNRIYNAPAIVATIEPASQ